MAKQIITIIDYGSGNLHSAAKAFEHMANEYEIDCDIRISSNPQDLRTSDRIVLPGQGAFGDCIDNLTSIDGMIETLNETVLQGGKAFLGICVGMQLLADKGYEKGAHKGLGWIPGEVIPLAPQDPALKIPHMGWNTLQVTEEQQLNPNFVLRSIDSSPEKPTHYYFVHSFCFKIKESKNLYASCNYGGHFPAIIGRDNVIGMQFHPEKSHNDGLKLIGDFMLWKP